MTLTEATGLYDDTDNTTGYGGPNPAFGDTTPYTATFYKPKSSTPEAVLDLLDNPPTPNVDAEYEYTIPIDGEVVSGVWTIEVLHGTESKRLAYLATGEIEKRIRKCVCCDDKKHGPLYDDLQGAIRSFKCFKNKEAQEVIDELYRKTAECCDCGC